MSCSTNLKMRQGETFAYTVRVETPPYRYIPVTNITQSAPVEIETEPHGLVSGQRVAVISARGMKQINAVDPAVAKVTPTLPKVSAYRPCTVTSPTTLQLNDVDSSFFSPYTGGGYVMSLTSMVLDGFTARMALRTSVGGDLIHTLTTENGGITIDPVKKQVNLRVPASITAGFTFRTAYYDLELVAPNAAVFVPISGVVELTREVTS